MCMYVCVCLYVCMCVFMYVCLYVCMCVCMCICMYVCVCMCILGHANHNNYVTLLLLARDATTNRHVIICCGITEGCHD